MKKRSIYLQKYTALAVLFLASSCSKVKNDLASQTESQKLTVQKMSTAFPTGLNYGDTLLNITYENGALNSGITGVTSTNATAADAAFMVNPAGNGTNYAIAHKVVYGDQGYNSDGNWRSESDAINIIPARYAPGDERRYEFSVFMKDWILNPADPAETNLFQLKLSEGEVPLQVRTTRNTMVLRFALANAQPSVTVISDAQSHVNQWIHFRIDVKWATDATGYMKTYMKLQGESDYTLKDNKTNYLTYNTSGNGGQVGYIKWGIYIVPQNTTRIAYHDNIRIINMNQPPTTPGLIWGNSVPDANPAYLDGPYTIAPNIANRAAYNNTSHVYIHPNIKYDAAQNIVYFNSTSPAPNPADNVVGMPRSDFSRSTLTAGGASGSPLVPGPIGRYLLGGWNNATSASTPSTLDSTRYYEFYLEPLSGYYFNFNDIKFTVLRGGTAHPNTFALRSSIDNFGTNISDPVTISGTTTPTAISFNASAFSNISTAVTFRLYAYGATATSGSTLVGVNDFQVNGQVLPSP